MADVVTIAGSMTCSHQGSLSLTSAAKLRVDGKPVVVYADVPSFTPFTGCTFPSTSSGAPPCSNAVPISQGHALKLTAGVKPVLLDNLRAGTNNPPPPPAASVTVVAGQAKLTAS